MAIGKRIYAMLYALCVLRYLEATMPAIASLEDLKSAQRDFRSMFLVVTPNDLRLTIYGQSEMAQDRLEECM
jgi:hypothetical protein